MHSRDTFPFAAVTSTEQQRHHCMLPVLFIHRAESASAMQRLIASMHACR